MHLAGLFQDFLALSKNEDLADMISREGCGKPVQNFVTA